MPVRYSFVLMSAIGLACLLDLTSCRSTGTDQASANETVVVKAPAAGQIQRLLISEGTRVDAGAPLMELAPESTPTASGTPSESTETRAAKDLIAAERSVETARAEVVRNEANVQRLTPLVAAGQATQAELDGAQAQYQQAQQRFRGAQDAARAARGNLDTSRQPGTMPPDSPSPNETKTISVPAPVAGIVTVIAGRVGDRVIVGQPLATIRPN
jgi:cobalt-zinc-cadmium efflux system membrane fusion protein